MNDPVQVNFNLLAYGSVGAGLVLSWVLNIAFGGFKIGRLAREIELTVPRDQLPAYLATVHHRLAALGFTGGESPGSFVQKGSSMGDLGSSTHAKTHKVVNVSVDDSTDPEAHVTLALKYQQLIVGDTGETAYADAVLAYVSYQTDSMQPVANRSFMAFSSFVFGIWTWVVLVALKAFRIEPFFAPVLVLGITNVATSIMAMVMVFSKPKEVSGLWLAIVGLVTSVLALVVAAVLAFLSFGNKT